MYDDEEFEEDEDEDEALISPETEAYVKKGTEDRAFVDQQSKDYDEMKRKKRDEINKLKSARLALQSKLSTKGHKLATLKIQIRKDAYLETRERVANEREVAMRDSAPTREEVAEDEVETIASEAERQVRIDEYDALYKEFVEIESHVNEISRSISLLEYELIRS